MPDLGILFDNSRQTGVQGYSDSDYLSCKNTRRFVGSYLFTFANGPISWASKQQPSVSDSTTEAEYKAVSEAAKEVVYIRRLLQELDIQPLLKILLACPDAQVNQDLKDAGTPTQADLHLSCDNQGALKLAKNPLFHAKTKHIEGKHHFVCERVLEGEIDIKYIHTDENPADLLTKPLPRHKFKKHRYSIGVRSLQQVVLPEDSK
jgi:hypothetical protein